METTTIIRIVAGILFAITLTYLIQRRRKKVS
jgi:LPXTG-motif cell wall-anchored protein